MKKTFIAISIILIILSIGTCHNSRTVGLFESIDPESIDTISISYFGGGFSTKDKGQILEIMNYLKESKFTERSNNSVLNTSPDAVIGLSSKNSYDDMGVLIYGYVARLLPEEKDGYTIPDGFYQEIDNICKKYK
ncbi:hypothetical protein FDC35_12825 [Clostridium botulinum]|uniref:hypothetical protein n=1 Tax=unclassified Clostridium TaxID=2614128 RepID=UPI0013F050CE|nr:MULTISPECIES: hypothetical protein [unclassified Clostridium]NFH70241.1 hypothetical protein [Clostridium botulinum]NFP01735.1 hypothetical protein [Clostridium botulinum]